MISSFISKAKRIFILGFGYAEENLKLLRLSHFLTPDKEVYGTAFGSTDREINDIVQRIIPLRNSTVDDNIIREKLKIKDCNCYKLLREYL
jgi:hypothetical protein